MDKGKKKSKAPTPLSEARSKKLGISKPKPVAKPKPQPDEPPRPLERLQKVIAEAGLASRRNSEQLILQRRVRVNGKVVEELGTKVDPTRDVISVDNKELPLRDPNEAKLYLLLHKPRGYVTTADDERGRPTVLELVGSVATRVYPVGRLDSGSEGLLVMTNDGDLTYRLTHPRYKVDKEYEVQTDGVPTEADLQRLRNGVELDDGVRTQPAIVELLHHDNEHAWLRFIISEGRNRQIRRMLEVVGYRTRRLIRMRMGPLRLGELKRGDFRVLTAAEARALRKAAGLDTEVKVETHPTPAPTAHPAPRRAYSNTPATPIARPSRFATQAGRPADRAPRAERPAPAGRPSNRPARPAQGTARPPQAGAPSRPPRPAQGTARPPQAGAPSRPVRSGTAPTRPFPANSNPFPPKPSRPSRPPQGGGPGGRPSRPFPANGNPARPAPSKSTPSNRPARPAGPSHPPRPSGPSSRPTQGGNKGKRER